MRDRVKYFSNFDLSVSHYLQKAGKIVEKYHSGWKPDGINDVIELYNIWLFVDNGLYLKNWSDEILKEIQDYKNVVILYFKQMDVLSWPKTYHQVVFDYRDDFWEIIDRFDITGIITQETLREALSQNTYELRYVLEREKLVKQYDTIVADLLKSNENTAEWLLSEFVEEKRLGNNDNLYFPASFSLKDRESAVSEYLDRPEPNLNYVRLVRVAKKDSNLRLSDEVVLRAARVEERLNNQFFNRENSVHFQFAISLNDEPNKPLKWIERDKDSNPILCYSKRKMLEFRDAELIHYCRYVFEMLTMDGMIFLVSKESDAGVMERLMGLNGKYSYPTNIAFRYNEAISLLQIGAMINVLQSDGRTLEAAIKAFYERHLKQNYGYPSNTLTLPDSSLDWVSKCRIIAPEIEIIAKRYDQFARKGEIDEELLQMNTGAFKATGTISCNKNKYYTLKGQPGGLYRLFYLFFSDQSLLSFVDPFKEQHYGSFYQLLAEQDGKIKYDNYEQYQLRDIDFLIEEGFLSKDEDGCLSVEKKMEIGLLRQLYEYHTCPIAAYGVYGQDLLRQMREKEWLAVDNHLFSIKERNYLDYYLYNTPFTNAPALLNRYINGSNSNPGQENAHKNAYYRLLIILILELLKIEDDLICKRSIKNKSTKGGSNKDKTILLGKEANVITYSSISKMPSGEECLLVPKKMSLEEGYIYISTMNPLFDPSYVIKGAIRMPLEYISFFLNSSLVRMDLIKQSPARMVQFTIERIKAIELPIADGGVMVACAKLEHLIAGLKAYGDRLEREEKLQLSLFSSLRDYLCLELLHPKFKKEFGIEIVSLFVGMMNKVYGDDRRCAQMITEELTKPGNLLMDNMKKTRIVLAQGNKK